MTDYLTAHRPTVFAIAWAITMLFAATAVILSKAVGLSFSDTTTPILVTACIGVVALAYGVSGRSAILSDMAHWTVLWVLFSVSAGVATYAAAACGGPTNDAAFVALDARLGFSWAAWYDLVTHHPALRFVLAIAYSTLMPQIIFSIIYFGLHGRNDRNAEFFFTTLIAFVVTLALSRPWCAALFRPRRGRGPILFRRPARLASAQPTHLFIRRHERTDHTTVIPYRSRAGVRLRSSRAVESVGYHYPSQHRGADLDPGRWRPLSLRYAQRCAGRIVQHPQLSVALRAHLRKYESVGETRTCERERFGVFLIAVAARDPL